VRPSARQYLSAVLHGSRLESVCAPVPASGLHEDMLDNEEQLQDQLESLPYLCRFQYETSAAYLLSLMDPSIETYKAASMLLPQQVGLPSCTCGKESCALCIVLRLAGRLQALPATCC
jgi:hypothetical protein